MIGFKNLPANEFIIEILKDSRTVFTEVEFDATALALPEDTELDEFQYYVHKVGFYLIHTLTWCKQLDLAIEFLSNYDYSKKLESTRADHLIYNLENYLIRLNSVYDRVLQIVNAVFHLCINEENVNHLVIVSNYKVQHNISVHNSIKKIKKFLSDYAQARHTLIHKHSWQDLKLKKIELFYLNKFDDPSESDEWKKTLKLYRARFLGEYISEKKSEFMEINTSLSSLLIDLFDLLLIEYNRQKAKLS